MIRYLLRCDTESKALSAVAITLPLALLIPLASTGLRTYGAGHAMAITWVVYPALLLGFLTRRRASSFYIALPIPARNLFALRMASALLMVWSPALLLALIGRPPGFAPNYATGFAEAGAIVTLAIAIQALVRPSEAVVPIKAGVAIWIGTGSAGIASLYLLPPFVQIPAFAAAGAVAFWFAWRAVPSTYQVAPVDAIDEGPRRAGRESRLGPSLVVWKSAHPWVGLLLLFPLGLLTGICPQFTNASLLFLFFGVAVGRQGSGWLSALPLSRRATLGITLAVMAAPYLAGAAAGIAISPSIQLPLFKEIVGAGPLPYRGFISHSFTTDVPLEYWRPAPGGIAPVIRAPWGETVQPTPMSILGFKVYNPYETGPSNSDRFYEWQFARATTAVHGHAMTSKQYVEYDPFESHVPQVEQQPRFRILTLTVYLFGCLAIAFVHEVALSHSWRFRNSLAAYRRVGLALLAPLIIGLLADEFYLWNHATDVTTPIVRAILLRMSAALPQNLWAVAGIAILPSVCLYFLAERQSARSELSGQMLWLQLRQVGA